MRTSLLIPIVALGLAGAACGSSGASSQPQTTPSRSISEVIASWRSTTTTTAKKTCASIEEWTSRPAGAPEFSSPTCVPTAAQQLEASRQFKAAQDAADAKCNRTTGKDYWNDFTKQCENFVYGTEDPYSKRIDDLEDQVANLQNQLDSQR